MEKKKESRISSLREANYIPPKTADAVSRSQSRREAARSTMLRDDCSSNSPLMGKRLKKKKAKDDEKT